MKEMKWNETTNEYTGADGCKIKRLLTNWVLLNKGGKIIDCDRSQHNLATRNNYTVTGH